MSYNDDLRKELEQHLNNQHATQVGDVTDALVVSADEGEADEDTLLQQLTQAVNPEPEYLGDEGGGSGPATTPPTSTPPTGLSLNAGVDGDERLTAWLQSRLNS